MIKTWFIFVKNVFYSWEKVVLAFSWSCFFFPHVGMLLLCGGLVNGPYALITTAVSADLVRPEALWETAIC